MLERGKPRRGFLAGVLFAVLACVVPAQAGAGCVLEGAEEGLELRVMTFNIRYGTANDGENRWELRRDLVFKVLREHRPDVAGLQEALRFQLDEIRKALPQYGEVGVGRDDGKEAGEYSAIIYLKDRLEVLEQGTFWFSNTPEVPGSKHWGNTIPRICTWARFRDKKTGRSFYVYNVHLDHRSQPSRERSAVLLAERIASRAHPDPVIVTGDFNAGEDNPAILYLLGRAELPGRGGKPHRSPVKLADTFRVLHPNAREVGTFNGFRGRTDGPKIDYVFTHPWVEVLEARIVRDHEGDRWPSDHFPVEARLRFPPVRQN